MERKAEIFSFFSGAGFLDLGFEEAGFRIVMFGTTAAEVLAVQGMPERYAMPPGMTPTDKYKAAGNGVPFLMAKGVAEAAGRFLDGLT